MKITGLENKEIEKKNNTGLNQFHCQYTVLTQVLLNTSLLLSKRQMFLFLLYNSSFIHDQMVKHLSQPCLN